VPIAQPIRTLNGRPAFQGSPVNLYAAQSECSVLVLDRDGALVVNEASESLGSNLIRFIQSGTGAEPRDVQDKLREQAVTPQDFMDGALQTKVALRTATSADAAAIGAAIQAAVNTGEAVYFPNGKYYVSDAVICDNPGQVLFGESRQGAVIHVPASFNLSASGVFVCDVIEPSPEFHTFGITFEQPDTAVRGNLIAYPPAIDAQGQARLRMVGMRIVAAMTGIDMRGNSGGALIDDLQISSFDYVVRIDGALDTVRIDNLHHWPFGLTSDQISGIFFDADNIGVESGRCDDLKIMGGLFIGGGTQVRFYESVSGNTFGIVSDTQFDTYGAVEMFSGNVLISNSHWSAGEARVRPIRHTGGNLRVFGCNFECAVTLTNPMFDSNVDSGFVAYVASVGNVFRLSGDTRAMRFAASAGLSFANACNNQFVLPANSSPAEPIVSAQAGSRLTFCDNQANDKGAGTGNLLAVAADDFHVIQGNAFLGWGLSLPASWSDLIAQDNSGVAQGDFIANRFVGKSYHARYIATADGSGNASILHGISAGNLKVLDVRAAFKGGSGEWTPCTVAFVDGAQISVTGAGAGARVRAFLTYTETQDAW
jgi:hypothetical protein